MLFSSLPWVTQAHPRLCKSRTLRCFNLYLPIYSLSLNSISLLDSVYCKSHMLLQISCITQKEAPTGGEICITVCLPAASELCCGPAKRSLREQYTKDAGATPCLTVCDRIRGLLRRRLAPPRKFCAVS